MSLWFYCHYCKRFYLIYFRIVSLLLLPQQIIYMLNKHIHIHVIVYPSFKAEYECYKVYINTRDTWRPIRDSTIAQASLQYPACPLLTSDISPDRALAVEHSEFPHRCCDYFMNHVLMLLLGQL